MLIPILCSFVYMILIILFATASLDRLRAWRVQLVLWLGTSWTTKEMELESWLRLKLSHIHIIQTGFEAHVASYTMGTRIFPLGVKQPGPEANHSPLTSPEVMEMWIYTSIPPYIFMVQWLIS
jgi:hypothetical protein